MSRPQNVDALAGAIRDYVLALMDQRDGRIAGGETVVQAQTNLRDAIKRVLGAKAEESAE
jgi:hypothetical protein